MAVSVARQGGFTLIELLVSTVILSAVLYTGSMAFSLFSKSWEGSLQGFDTAFRDARIKLLLHGVLADIRPYIASDGDGRQGLYFEGDVQGFVGVSARSLNYPEVPAVIRLGVVQAEDLTLALYYQEMPMLTHFALRFGETLDFSAPITIESGLSSVSFRYYGVDNTEELKDDSVESRSAKWYPNFNSYRSLSQPEKIEVNWRKSDGGSYGFVVDLIANSPALTLKNNDEGF